MRLGGLLSNAMAAGGGVRLHLLARLDDFLQPPELVIGLPSRLLRAHARERDADRPERRPVLGLEADLGPAVTGRRREGDGPAERAEEAVRRLEAVAPVLAGRSLDPRPAASPGL